jgi:hypothetical protein
MIALHQASFPIMKNTSIFEVVIAIMLTAPGVVGGDQVAKRSPTAKTAVKQAIEQRRLEVMNGTFRSKPKKSASPAPIRCGGAPTFYSAQRPRMAPLPFNPQPQRPVTSLGDNKFIYDDLDVDYEQRGIYAEASSSITTAPVGPAGKQAESSQSAAAQAGSVTLQINKVDANHFSLLFSNLNPGSEYLLADKVELINELTLPWSPSLLFTADATSLTIIGSFTEPSAFYSLWNLDQYSGPTVAIHSPASGSIVSGKVMVTGTVADILPDRVAELYVDGDFHSAITNGPLEIELDTQVFPNGDHSLDIVVRTVFLGEEVLEFSGVGSIPSVTFSNFVTSIDNGPFFSTAPALQFSTTGAAEYRLEILDEAGVLLRTFEGTTPGGVLQLAWDLRNDAGNPVPGDASYTFKMTTITSEPGAAAAASTTNQVLFASFAEGSFEAGHAFLVYLKRNFLSQNIESRDRQLLNFIKGAIEYADLIGPDPTGTRTALNDDIFLWRSNDERTNILSAIQRKDVGHIFYMGHGSPDAFGRGSDTIITTVITANEVRDTLTNVFNVATRVYNFRNPKRYVEMDGCSTGTGDLPLAFGIPRFSTDRFPNIARRSYMGWNNLIYSGWATLSKYEQHVQTQNAYWHSVEIDPLTIRQAITIAIIVNNYELDVSEIALHGSRLLKWPARAE